MPAKKYAIVSMILILVSSFTLTAFAKSSKSTCTTEEECAEKLKDAAEDLSEKSRLLDNLNSKISDLNKKISGLGQQLGVTTEEIIEIENEIKELELELERINYNLANRQAALEDKIKFRNNIIRSYSKKSAVSDIELLLGSASAGEMNLTGFQSYTLDYLYSKAMSSETLKIIDFLNSEIKNFEQNKRDAENAKNELEKSKTDLLVLKNNLETQKNQKLNEFGEVSEEKQETEEDLASIQERIDKLSTAQKSIIDAKSGAGTESVGNYQAPEYKLPDPPFSPAFAAMSYGAYTHYNGMSQYGAKGRADSGQDYKEILKFYYKVGVKKQDDFPSKISVQGYGDMEFQKYLYGIAEMPSDWHEDALKAQAIAARTYAYKSKKPICTSQSCQVFLKSKSDNPPARWKKAVDDTKNVILEGAATSQYSSTTGGYINNVGWDKAGGSWPGDAYEKKAKSPWFYKAWYTKTYNDNSDMCGRSSPWLSEKEMADILNSVTVFEKGNSSDRSKVSPITTKCWGGNPYSVDKMAERADELGNKYTSISSVDTDIGTNGKTIKITFQTNNGGISIDGDEFKTVFNLRAPGFISLRSRLYDFIKK
ncbi:hypothetical protein A3A69_01580 [candidate division WWE3 bacterium RIFCSPLOWO2_01_FULL_37_15]|uniref:Sporulation stage II protein D amidase enhancer LytB N-terminal domain-containing protein n=1 Tax=candidate division WWE3 bacterium RIFCSPLOWO2_01_FULL_37_15 TaxID=1802622 RepID=A0A1F4UT24_UNCKA|nr:MAG: hypothetical protein A3A69_01580 [candidate division WWE3 bacterium RIFCSPLOWO2_01_FULL_37_15]